METRKTPKIEMSTPCKYNPMHICDDGCATECRLWKLAKPTPAMEEMERKVAGTFTSAYCTTDDHRRYAARGKCMLCGCKLNPPNA
jgi:hypothetical protein